MHSEYRPVTNFKKGTPLVKRIGANILFFIGTTKITLRDNLLSPTEYRAVKNMLEPGDIVLAGDHRHMSAVMIGGAVTHSLLALGGTSLIHAVGHGVEKTKLRALFKQYDTLAVMRPRLDAAQKGSVIPVACAWAVAQIGKPYDYEFDTDTEKFFCTQLVNRAYHEAGYDLALAPMEPEENPVLERMRRWKHAVRPSDVAHGNVDPVFLSRFLTIRRGSLTLSEPLWIKNAEDALTRIAKI